VPRHTSSRAFKEDATFMPIGELADPGATAFRSFNYPGRYFVLQVLGREYTTGTEYDLLGRQSWVEYPDGERVNYAYDTAGRLHSMWSSTQSYVDSLRYHAVGLLTYAKLPNGLEENFHCDFEREWLTEASVQPADDTPPQQGSDLYQACSYLSSVQTPLGQVFDDGYHVQDVYGVLHLTPRAQLVGHDVAGS
jgi:hypothetical protein